RRRALPHTQRCAVNPADRQQHGQEGRHAGTPNDASRRHHDPPGLDPRQAADHESPAEHDYAHHDAHNHDAADDATNSADSYYLATGTPATATRFGRTSAQVSGRAWSGSSSYTWKSV